MDHGHGTNGREQQARREIAKATLHAWIRDWTHHTHTEERGGPKINKKQQSLEPPNQRPVIAIITDDDDEQMEHGMEGNGVFLFRSLLWIYY
jgi:hypothetical protein